MTDPVLLDLAKYHREQDRLDRNDEILEREAEMTAMEIAGDTMSLEDANYLSDLIELWGKRKRGGR